MRRLFAIGLLLGMAAGCITGRPYSTYPGGVPNDPAYSVLPGPGTSAPAASLQNPVFVSVSDPEFVWETVSDVVDDYFSIEREEPVRRVGEVLTEGRLDTLPEVGSTFLEPWRRDSADSYEKLQATLQTIRRRAVVRVIPAERGFWVDVNVFKELEDLSQPEQATAGVSTFRNDATLTRVVNPVGVQEVAIGWIPQGRDTVLEQRIVAQLIWRVGSR